MRDIKKYENDYKILPFEDRQLVFRRKQVINFLNEYKPKRILEIGCGLEPIFKYYNDFQEMYIVEPGIDFIKNAEAEALLLPYKSSIKIVHSFFESSLKDIKNIKFDFIIVSSLLHEVKEVDDFLSKLREIASANTIIHINVPNALSFHRLLALESELIKDLYELSDTQKIMQQHHTFDLESLSKLVIEAGFKIVDSGSYFLKPFTHFQMEKLIEEAIISDKILIGFDKMIKYLPDFGSEIFVNLKLSEK